MSCRHHGRPRPPSDSKTLTFLVRDWAHGQQLNEGQNQSPKELPMTSQEQSILESFIHSTTEGQGLGQFFESLECRTLPHPGHIDRPSWTGDAKEISDDFLVGCRGLFCTLATMASAQTGAAVTVQDFEQTLQEYIAVLNSARDLTESGTSHRTSDPSSAQVCFPNFLILVSDGGMLGNPTGRRCRMLACSAPSTARAPATGPACIGPGL